MSRMAGRGKGAIRTLQRDARNVAPLFAMGQRGIRFARTCRTDDAFPWRTPHPLSPESRRSTKVPASVSIVHNDSESNDLFRPGAP